MKTIILAILTASRSSGLEFVASLTAQDVAQSDEIKGRQYRGNHSR